MGTGALGVSLVLAIHHLWFSPHTWLQTTMEQLYWQ